MPGTERVNIYLPGAAEIEMVKNLVDTKKEWDTRKEVLVSVIKKEKESFKEEGEKEISSEISKTTEKSTSNMLEYEITDPKDLIKIANIIQNGSKLETSLLSYVYFGTSVLNKSGGDGDLYDLREKKYILIARIIIIYGDRI